MKIACPHCGVHGSVEDSLAGKKLRCPKCSKVFLVTEDILPDVGESSLAGQGLFSGSEPGPSAETDEQLLAATDEVQESVGESETADDTELAICSLCGQSFAPEDLVDVDSRLYCALCRPDSDEEDEEEGVSEDELLQILAEDEYEEEGEDLPAEEEDFLEPDDSGEEDAELEACSVCGELLHAGFLETVGDKRYCALCLPEDAELDEAEQDVEEAVPAGDDEYGADDPDVAQALLSDEDEFEGDHYLREACSVCGEKFHLDFLQEVDSKFYCGICQPEVIEGIVVEEGEESAVDTSDGLALEERAVEEFGDEGLAADAEEETWSGGFDFTIGELMKEAWQKTKGAKGAIWGGLIVMYAVLCGLGYAAFFAMQGVSPGADPTMAMGIGSGIQLLSTLLSTVFTAGIMLIGVRRAFEQRVSWSMVFAGFSKFFSITVAFILQTILVLIGFLLLVLPGIYLSVGYALAMPLILDKGLGPWQAMEASRKAIHKKWWTVFGLYLVMVLLTAASSLLLGLGLIWTIPMFFVLIGVLYVHLFGEGSEVEEEFDGVEEEEEV